MHSPLTLRMRSLVFAVDLVNTRPGASRGGTDELATPALLGELLRVSRYSGRVDGDEAERGAVRRLARTTPRPVGERRRHHERPRSRGRRG